MPDQYRRSLRSAVRGLWSGVIDEFEAWEMMADAVRLAFGRAWRRGAAACGVAEDELTPEEARARDQAVADEHGFIDGFLDAVVDGNRAAGGELAPLYRRAELWVKRSLDVENRAKAMACADKKLRWDLGAAEHCCSCLRLAGKVKRASFWNKAGVRPQHPSLHCMASAGGPSVCRCTFTPTDEPLSRGPLPNWRC